MDPLEQIVMGVLEGTIKALAHFDLERLLSLEEQMLQLAADGAAIQPAPPLVERHQRLRHTLEETRTNLVVLERLCSGKERERWER
jgi:hypothetical protein